MKLKNKNVVITGASRSIGRSIALECAKNGADILISYCSDKAGAIDTVREIESLGANAVAVHGDFSSTDGVEQFYAKLSEHFNSVDVLVNNAAGYDTASFLELEVNKFNELLQVGTTAPMYLGQLVARQMVGNKVKGAILNIASISAFKAHSNRVAHGTAKAALVMLTRNMAMDLAQYGIRVNALAPGNTPYEPIEYKESEQEHDLIPLARFGVPADQAKAALYLISEDASWVTGQVLAVDGGQSL